MEAVIATLIGQLIGALIGSLIGAVILRAAAKWVIKEDVPYGNAYLTVLLSTIINTVIGFFVGYSVGSATQSADAVTVASFLMLPVGFMIQSAIVSSRLEISFGKACLISLAMFAVAIGIAIVVGGIVFVVMQVTN